MERKRKPLTLPTTDTRTLLGKLDQVRVDEEVRMVSKEWRAGEKREYIVDIVHRPLNGGDSRQHGLGKSYLELIMAIDQSRKQ